MTSPHSASGRFPQWSCSRILISSSSLPEKIGQLLETNCIPISGYRQMENILLSLVTTAAADSQSPANSHQHTRPRKRAFPMVSPRTASLLASLRLQRPTPPTEQWPKDLWPTPPLISTVDSTQPPSISPSARLLRMHKFAILPMVPNRPRPTGLSIPGRSISAQPRRSAQQHSRPDFSKQMLIPTPTSFSTTCEPSMPMEQLQAVGPPAR